MARRTSFLVVTEPRIPPSAFIISSVAVCVVGSAQQASSTRRQSKPCCCQYQGRNWMKVLTLSFASRIVLSTHWSVVTPQMIKFLTPRTSKRSWKSV